MEWVPEFDVDADLARRLIAGQFPELAADSVARLGAGMDNVAYLVDDRYVFRFPRRSSIVPMFECEERILPLIAAALPTPIPFPRFIGKPDLGYPWTFAGYERLPGTTACSVSLSNAERSALAAPLGGFLRALHAIDPQVGESAGLPGDVVGRLDHAKRFPRAVKRFAELEEAGMITDPSVFLDILRKNAPGEPRKIRRIVHGDLYARHLLVDDDHLLSGIIDWGDVHLGDPAIDVMVAHLVLPASAHRDFIEAYGGVDEETWLLAKYVAAYHASLTTHFGLQIGDAALRDAGLAGLEFIRP